MDVREMLEQAEAFHKSGDFARAEQCYRAVLQADPTSLHAWFLLGAVCVATERFDEAISSFREAIRLRPEHAPTWNLLGVALGQQGRPAEAEACFLRVLQIRPGHDLAARNLERARREQSGASGAGQAGVGPPADSFEACCRRADAFCQQRRFAEAEAWYHEALRFRPDAADVLNDLGKVLALLSRPEEAVGTFRRAIAAQPDHARPHVNLAAVLLDLNRLDEAESAARRAAQLEPENPSAHNNLGLILQKRGRPNEAERSYREGLRRAPDHPELLVNFAYVLVLQGRAALAQEPFRRAPGAEARLHRWSQQLAVQQSVRARREPFIARRCSLPLGPSACRPAGVLLAPLREQPRSGAPPPAGVRVVRFPASPGRLLSCAACGGPAGARLRDLLLRRRLDPRRSDRADRRDVNGVAASPRTRRRASRRTDPSRSSQPALRPVRPYLGEPAPGLRAQSGADPAHVDGLRGHDRRGRDRLPRRRPIPRPGGHQGARSRAGDPASEWLCLL